MFGFGLKDKVKKVLRQDFGFEIPPSHTVDQVVQIANGTDMNEFDAAIMFMMLYMKSLPVGADGVDGFITAQSSNILRVLPRTSIPHEGIMGPLSELLSLHGLGSTNTTEHTTNQFASYKEWEMEFMRQCGKINPLLQMEESGEVFLALIDISPLLKAYKDGVPPKSIAEQLAPTFDAEDLGL